MNGSSALSKPKRLRKLKPLPIRSARTMQKQVGFASAHNEVFNVDLAYGDAGHIIAPCEELRSASSRLFDLSGAAKTANTKPSSAIMVR